MGPTRRRRRQPRPPHHTRRAHARHHRHPMTQTNDPGYAMEPATKPSVLFVYYTYTQQTLKVVETMADVLRERGCDVQLASIEFIDPRYADRFKHFPMPHPFREVVGMIPAELRRRPGEIRIPDIVTERAYDFVCIGSPTWWLSTNVPIRSFLESDTASQVLKGRPFSAAVACRR